MENTTEARASQLFGVGLVFILIAVIGYPSGFVLEAFLFMLAGIMMIVHSRSSGQLLAQVNEPTLIVSKSELNPGESFVILFEYQPSEQMKASAVFIDLVLHETKLNLANRVYIPEPKLTVEESVFESWFYELPSTETSKPLATELTWSIPQQATPSNPKTGDKAEWFVRVRLDLDKPMKELVWAAPLEVSPSF